MKFVDEFRNPALAKKLCDNIANGMRQLPYTEKKPLQVMEVCGGHTHTIFKFALDQILPKSVEFVHGPGCPVCVLPPSRLDAFISLAEQDDVILCTFGDAMRVPGRKGSLMEWRAKGADVRIVYSPLDALALAQKYPEKSVVFFALGFETTMPSTAMTLKQAKLLKVSNFFIFCQHITITPTLAALLTTTDVRVDAFLLPGHVSMIIGADPYQFLANDHHKPCAITGFEPLDILQGIWMVIKQKLDGRCEIENQYRRVVPDAGNITALNAMSAVFVAKANSEWRGLGNIAGSGIALAPDYAQFDAELQFDLTSPIYLEPAESRCGEVLTGQCKPNQCPLFGKECTPSQPIGALMVSSEGACAAYYQYRREQDL
jgi:hydrogenase expression/formation protein HypD